MCPWTQAPITDLAGEVPFVPFPCFIGSFHEPFAARISRGMWAPFPAQPTPEQDMPCRLFPKHRGNRGSQNNRPE